MAEMILIVMFAAAADNMLLPIGALPAGAMAIDKTGSTSSSPRSSFTW